MPAIPNVKIVEKSEARGMTYRLGGERDYTRTFWATSDIVTDQQAILLAPGLPRPGEFYVTAQGGIDVRATCREIDVRQRPEDPREWTVDCHYSSRWESSRSGGGPGGPGDGVSNTGGSPAEAAIENPLLRPTQIQPGTKKYQRPVEFDALPPPILGDVPGNPVLNAAGEKFDPPLMEEVVNLTLTITRNFAVLNLYEFSTYQNTINSDTYLGFAKKTLKVDDLQATYTYENGVYFWAVKAVLEKCPDGETWVRQVLNVGFNELVGGKPVPIFINGQRPSTPWPLTPKGKAIRDKAVDGDPNYIAVQTNKTLDFALLKLF